MPDTDAKEKTTPPLIDCPSGLKSLEYGTIVKANGKKYFIKPAAQNNIVLALKILIYIVLSTAIFIWLTT